MTLQSRLRRLTAEKPELPQPGGGETPARHRLLLAMGREDLCLARLAEAHYDAVAILREAGRSPGSDSLYGVWAADTPGQPLCLERSEDGLALRGSKMFCTGAGLVDRALVTVTEPEQRLVDVDLRENATHIAFDESAWVTAAFAETRTASAVFDGVRVAERDLIGTAGWYTARPGFWHGACGPAACWAGGAVGLVDYALKQSRKDPHTTAHLGAMKAEAWALFSYLDSAGREIDAAPLDYGAALSRALIARHLIEEACSDILRRFARAYGPRPLAFDADPSRRYRELELYIRQSHAERDLELLGRQSAY